MKRKRGSHEHIRAIYGDLPPWPGRRKEKRIGSKVRGSGWIEAEKRRNENECRAASVRHEIPERGEKKVPSSPCFLSGARKRERKKEGLRSPLVFTIFKFSMKKGGDQPSSTLSPRVGEKRGKGIKCHRAFHSFCVVEYKTRKKKTLAPIRP